MKRITLFAGYNHSDDIEEYVVYYLKELAKYSDVYYFADNDMPVTALKRILPIVTKAWAHKHGKYDFGSWQEIIRRIGWNTLQEYDNLIFTNDSIYGPLTNMGQVFAQMDSRHADFWGITENYGGGYPHIQSYFLAFSKNIFSSPLFTEFIEKIEAKKDKIEICVAYEIGLSKLLTEAGFSRSCYITDREPCNIPHYFDITAFQNSLIDMGSPFIKRKVFFDKNFPNEDITTTFAKLYESSYPDELLPAKL